MKVHILPIVSPLHGKRVEKETEELLASLKAEGIDSLLVEDFSSLYRDCDLSLILVQSGGSENVFKTAFETGRIKTPCLLLTTGKDNSLAASLEILAFLQKRHLPGEVLHGPVDYLSSRMKALAERKFEDTIRLGVLGKPSDWLIASDVDPDKAKALFGFEIVDVPMERVVEAYRKETGNLPSDFDAKGFTELELEKAYRLYLALKTIEEEEHLSGLSIRCFDLLGTLKTTACLALALLNDEGDNVGTCEGDIPSLIGMALCKKILSQGVFQCNPSRLDILKKRILLAHCTLPLSLCRKHAFDTHFESGIGVAIRGEIEEGDVTLFRLDSDLGHFFLQEGRLVENRHEEGLCRSQVVVEAEGLEKILRRPLGNHLLLIKEHHADKLASFLIEKGLERI